MLFVYLVLFILLAIVFLIVVPLWPSFKAKFRKGENPQLINKLKSGGGYLNDSQVVVGKPQVENKKSFLKTPLVMFVIVIIAFLFAALAYYFVRNGPKVYFDNSVQDRRLGREIFEMLNGGSKEEASESATPTPFEILQ